MVCHENRNQSIGSCDVLLVQLCANGVSAVANAAGTHTEKSFIYL